MRKRYAAAVILYVISQNAKMPMPPCFKKRVLFHKSFLLPASFSKQINMDRERDVSVAVQNTTRQEPVVCFSSSPSLPFPFSPKKNSLKTHGQ